jgi:F/Y-rich N-terminus
VLLLIRWLLYCSVKKSTEEDDNDDAGKLRIKIEPFPHNKFLQLFRLLLDLDSDGSNYDPNNDELESSLSLQKLLRRSAAKKRKAKDIDTKSGRFYYEMERDQCGQPILPVEIDSWTVISLGVIDAERPAFHTARYIYPIGYTIKKYVNVDMKY